MQNDLKEWHGLCSVSAPSCITWERKVAHNSGTASTHLTVRICSMMITVMTFFFWAEQWCLDIEGVLLCLCCCNESSVRANELIPRQYCLEAEWVVLVCQGNGCGLVKHMCQMGLYPYQGWYSACLCWYKWCASFCIVKMSWNEILAPGNQWGTCYSLPCRQEFPRSPQGVWCGNLKATQCDRVEFILQSR